MDPSTSMRKTEKKRGSTRSGTNPDLDDDLHPWSGRKVQFIAWDGMNSRERREAQHEKGRRHKNRQKKTGAQRRKEAREKTLERGEASTVDRRYHPAKSDAPQLPISAQPPIESASTDRATPAAEVTPQQGEKPRTPKSIIKRKTQAFTDAPNRRLFEEAPPTQRSRFPE